MANPPGRFHPDFLCPQLPSARARVTLLRVPDVFHVEDSDVWENLSFCPRHVLVNNLQPADGPSVRAKVCSDLRAGSAEVTAKIASS